MKLIAPIIMVLVMIKCPSLMAQKSKVQFGLSTNFGIALFTNRAQLTDAYYASVPESGSVGKHTFKLGYLSKRNYTFDFLFPNHFKFSVGLRQYNFQFKQDSVFNIYSWQSYGTKEVKRMDALFTVGGSRRISILKFWGIEPFLSFGMTELFYSVFSHSTAYDPSQQVYHDFDDRDYSRFDIDGSIHDLELGSNFYYQLGWFNFNLGLSYYLYHKRNNTTHQGLYLNAGIGVRFGEDKSRSQLTE